jgi:hypothetical protein
MDHNVINMHLDEIVNFISYFLSSLLPLEDECHEDGSQKEKIISANAWLSGQAQEIELCNEALAICWPLWLDTLHLDTAKI